MSQLKKDAAVELTNEVYEAFNKYFSSLTKLGYKPYNEVYKLLAISFIEEMLYGPMSFYITEDDYRIIDNGLDCLYGSCMIPYPDYKKSFNTIVHKLPDEYRLTEDGVFRITEDSKLRVES